MFPGFGATKRALQSGVPYAGVTVHFIDAGVDTGPIIVQKKIAIEAADDEQTLGRRQFEAAVPLLLQTVRQLERGQEPCFDRPDADLVRFAASYNQKV
jgi:phosphoribosylglycinamide formyltransferase-1